MSPSRAWYHSRYVSFLIEETRFDEATRVWSSALKHLQRIQSVSLAQNLHRWVVMDWLRRGRAQEAFEAYRTLDDDVWKQTPALRQVRQLVLDAHEADHLGAEVYPAGFPVDQRWSLPRILPEALDGLPLE